MEKDHKDHVNELQAALALAEKRIRTLCGMVNMLSAQAGLGPVNVNDYLQGIQIDLDVEN